MTATTPLAITRLTLTDFRGYAGLRLDVTAATIALSGPNGAGKTNLLEAISLLTPGRGLRGASFDDLARIGGSGGWAVACDLDAAGGPVSLGTGWSPGNGEGRAVMIGGRAERSSGALGRHMRLLWLTPAMDRLFAGPASDRRRFLDRLVATFDPEHGSRLGVFEKVMRERNLLLDDSRPDSAWISSLEAPMAEAGIAIAAARIAMAEVLQGHIAMAREGSAFPWADIAVEGEIEALIAAMPAVRAEDEYRRLLAESRSSDKAAGRTLRGPHRSNLAVRHGPKAMPAAHCSTGEQKALLIGLILAQARAVKAEARVAPVLLLDEVAAHLDAERRQGLFAALAELGCQAWMTGTDAHLFEGLGHDTTVFHVEDARVSEVTGLG